MYQQAAATYTDLREQGLSAAAAREHVRLQYGYVIQDDAQALPGSRTGRFNCSRPNLSNPVIATRRAV